MANPLVKIAVTASGFVAARLGRRIADAGWGAVFGEEPPDVGDMSEADAAAKINEMQDNASGA